MRLLACLATAVALLVAACSPSPDEPSPGPASPTPAPTPSAVLGLDVEAFLECLDRGGIAVEDESDPEFGATSQLRVELSDQGGEDLDVVVYVFATAEDAEQAQPDIGGVSQRIGTAVVTGLEDVSSAASLQDEAVTIVGCLGVEL